MTKHFFREIEKLKRQVLSLGSLVEEALFLSVKAVLERDAKLAKQVIESDKVIDSMEVEVEEDCLKILALHQPVAQDLRFVIAVLKINNDLERIGDLAVSIAWRAHSLSVLAPVQHDFHLVDMSTKVKAMLRRSLEALVNLDAQAAKDICEQDNVIDTIHNDNNAKIRSLIRDESHNSEAFMYISNVSRNLERIADHSTNIAEDVYYLVEGEIVRHRKLLR